jgi:hypothetical protein
MVFNKLIKNSPFRELGGLLLLLCTSTVHAQTFAEWFSQGKTQIKYLTQQIAALNAFESSMKQGYRMMKNEWGAIGNFKNGEFGLHQGYYNSMLQVSPVVKSSTDIMSLQVEQQGIISRFNSITNLAGLAATEQAYIQSVRQNVITLCNKDLDDLQTVLTTGKLQMTDDERIKRINQLTAAIKDEYIFTCAFCTQVRLLAIQRTQDSNDAQTLGGYYGNN